MKLWACSAKLELLNNIPWSPENSGNANRLTDIWPYRGILCWVVLQQKEKLLQLCGCTTKQVTYLNLTLSIIHKDNNPMNISAPAWFWFQPYQTKSPFLLSQPTLLSWTTNYRMAACPGGFFTLVCCPNGWWCLAKVSLIGFQFTTICGFTRSPIFSINLFVLLYLDLVVI